MRKNKGYQRDLHRGIPVNSFPAGENKSLEQCIADVNREFDIRIQNTIKDYERVCYLMFTGVNEKDLYDECRKYLMWGVKFDDDHQMIPLEKALDEINDARRIMVDRTKYGKWCGYQKRIVNKDNSKFCYNPGSNSDCEWHHKVRVPSLKRSAATWRKFYELFPGYEKMSHDPEKCRKYNLKKL